MEEEEKKYLDYEGLLEYHRNIKELITENEKITSSALNDLNNRIIENEKVISSALNDLDDRIENFSLDDLSDRITENEKITSSSLNDLNDRIIETSSSLNDLNDRIVENEKIVSSALNDLNTRIGTGSNLNEVEIGRTTPSDPNVKIFIDENEDPAVSLDVYTRTQTNTLLADKVDKVTGKGLSTNDFNDTAKDKLDDLPSTSEIAASGGTDLSLVTTGEKYTWNNMLPLTGGTITSNKTLALTIKSTSTSLDNYWGVYVNNPNITAGQTLRYGFGKSLDKKNSATIAYEYAGNASDSNLISFNHYGVDNILNILASGRVGINTTSPKYMFEANGGIGAKELSLLNDGVIIYHKGTVDILEAFSNYIQLGYGSAIKGYDTYIGGNNVHLRASTSNTEVLHISSNLNVGIGTTSPSYKLHVAGAVCATQYNNTSDIRKKDIIENLDLDVEDIANAPLFKFTWLDPEMPEGVNVGTSAQYWQTIIPEIVSEANDDEKTLSMQYGVAGLASSIALARKVVEQENTIKAQEARIKALENAIAEIQNKLK